jgi:D-alanyl-D-alanine carboxypeptidase/D-alanyl-D-alanine-endopeptidase (penicillin-binding protein 4)
MTERYGLDPSRYSVVDGSGVSLYNYASAELLVRALLYARQRSNIYGHLYPSLPVAGEDGTLRSRMRGTGAQYNVHAKTGTVEGVITLAGYAMSPEGHELAFAIMNQGVLHARNARRFQDRVCRAITEK